MTTSSTAKTARAASVSVLACALTLAAALPAALAAQTVHDPLPSAPSAILSRVHGQPRPEQSTSSASVLAQQDEALGRAAGSGYIFHAPATTAGPGGEPIEQAQPSVLRLGLDDAIALGLTRNVRLKYDYANQREDKGFTLSVINVLVPNLSLNAQSSAQELNLAAMGFKPSLLAKFGIAPGTIPLIVKVNTTQADLRLNQVLFNISDYELYRGTKNEANLVDLNTLSDRGDVVLTVAMAYLQVLADQANLANAVAQERSAKTVADQAIAKRDAGVGINLDALRGRVQYVQQQQQTVAAQTQLAKDKIQLLRIAGLPAGQELELTDVAPFAEMAEMDLDRARATAYVHRKDLLGLQQQIELTVRESKAVKTQRLPTLAFNGYYGVIGDTAAGSYHGSFVAEGTLNVPLFNEASQRGQQEVVSSQLVALRQQEASLRVTVEAQIRSAMLDVEAAEQLVKVAQSSVGLAQQELADARDRFAAGVDNDLPVVDAEASVAQAQSQLVQSLFQFNVAKLQLARYTGVVETRYRTYLGK